VRLVLAQLILTAFLWPAALCASDGEPKCPDVYDNQGAIQVQQMQLVGRGCSIRFYNPPMTGESRQWLFNSIGRIGAFISSPGGSNSKNTGVRVFYIIPTEDNYSLSGVGAVHPGSNENSHYKINMGGDVWLMEKKTGKLSAPANCKAMIQDIPGGIKGGFQLDGCKTKLVLDVGWMIGTDPEMNREARSTFRDYYGHYCSVPNIKIFNYTRYDHSLKYNTQGEWARFLSTVIECKNLNIPWLADRPAIDAGSSVAPGTR